MGNLILCIDIGTTGCCTIIFNEKGNQISKSYQEYQSIYLSSRWIDHDPKTWLQAVRKTVKEAVKKMNMIKIEYLLLQSHHKGLLLFLLTKTVNL